MKLQHMESQNQKDYSEKLIRQLINGEFGIEKESLRVDVHGWLAKTPHPNFEDARISMDFSESQVELISDVYDHLQGACGEICFLQGMVEEQIFNRSTGSEYMWNYSNPPLFAGKDGILIAEFADGNEKKTCYRQYLAEKYGKVKMLYSGVHLNFSMPKEFFAYLPDEFGTTIQEKKSTWYVKLADALMMDSWLLVALTAASPVADESFLELLGVPKMEWTKYASFRSSKYGYWNFFVPELAYDDFESYVNSVERYINQGEICSIQELYYPIRLKPVGENTLENLRENGVNHIELRMLDLNPMCCSGVSKRDLIFIHLLIVYRTVEILYKEGVLSWDEVGDLFLLDKKGDGQTQKICDRFVSDAERILLHQEAAEIAFWEEHLECKAYALQLIEDMKGLFGKYEKMEGCTLPEDYFVMDVLEFEAQKIREPKMRYANQLREKYGVDYVSMRMREILGILFN